MNLRYAAGRRTGPAVLLVLACASLAMSVQASPLADDSVMARASGFIFKYFHLGDSVWRWDPFTGDFNYGNYWNTWYRGYCQFDISDVADTVTVDSASLAFLQFYQWSLDWVQLRWLELQSPGQMSPMRLCEHIDTGATSASGPVPAANGWLAAGFSAEGLDSLNAAIARHQDSIMIGFDGWLGHGRAYGCTTQVKPRLRLYYRGSSVNEQRPAGQRSYFCIRPNPVSDGFVRIEPPPPADVLVTVYDAFGRKACEFDLPALGSAATIDLRPARAGVYIVRVADGGRFTTQTLTVLRR